MKNFEYFTPTRVVFGKDTEQGTGELGKAQGCQKALVHFGGESAKKSGLLDRVLASLHKAGVAYEVLGGVIPNPRLATVYPVSYTHLDVYKRQVKRLKAAVHVDRESECMYRYVDSGTERFRTHCHDYFEIFLTPVSYTHLAWEISLQRKHYPYGSI